MKYYLGMDAGGSKTYTLVVDQHGKIVGKGKSGNGNHQINVELARKNIQESSAMALHDAGLEPGDIEYAFLGLAGADREADYKILRPIIHGLGFSKYDFTCDTMIALRAGTSRPYGVVLICGSGTNSAGKNRLGQFYQCGGFSYRLGDVGGGGALSVEAFRSVIRAWDGRERPTLMTELLLEFLGYKSVEKMFDDYLNPNKILPIHTAKLLFDAALLGDEVAKDVLQRQGEELGKSACAVIKRLGMEQESFDVVLAGSIITRGKGTFVNEYIKKAVSAIALNATVVKLTVEPAVGAVWMAMEAAEGKLPQEAYDRLRAVSDYNLINVE